MTLFEILRSLETNEEIHLGRIIVLLNEFSGKNKGEIEGLTKLAKLDFLLRYPVYLERALKTINKTFKWPIREYERVSVESKMVRFKYGPWDFRYRKFINILVGLGIVYVRLEGRSYNLGLTDKGIQVAQQIVSDQSFTDLAERAKTIRIHFDNTGTFLMKFIYKTFPEIGSLQYGDQIT